MKSVTICGSNKFAKEAMAFGKALEKLGVTVYMPHFYSASHLGDWNRVNDFDKKFLALGLTHDHFYKIRMGDVILIFNKNGYAGNSTTLEIGYALASDKPIYAISDKDEELRRQILFQGITKTPQELFKKLK